MLGFPLTSPTPPPLAPPPPLPSSPGKLATVRVPYLTFFNSSFTDKTSYWNKFCKPQPTGSDPISTTTTSISDKVKVEVKEAATAFSDPDPNHVLSTIAEPHMALQPLPLYLKRFPKLFAGKKTQSTASLTNINPKGYFPVRHLESAVKS